MPSELRGALGQHSLGVCSISKMRMFKVHFRKVATEKLECHLNWESLCALNMNID